MAGDAGVSYYDDGSSTESEPFDDDELEAPPPTPDGASPSAEPASQAPVIEKTPAPKTVLEIAVSPADASHNVLDLFALPSLVPPPRAPSPVAQDAPLAVVLEPIPPAQALPSVSIENSVDLTAGDDSDAATTPAYDAAAKCGKCQKLVLSEAAYLALQLVDSQSFFCHCCGLTLPWFCFTEPQRVARRPECRGCRGVPTVIGFLTARVKKLVLGQQQRQSTASSRPSKPSAPSISPGLKATTAAAPAPAVSPHPTSATDAADTDPPAKPSRKQLPCALCGLPLVRVTKAQSEARDKLKCSCCERELALEFFSKNQRSKGNKKRCKGCLGNIGKRANEAVAAATKAWRAAHPVDEKAKEEQKLAKQQRKLEEKQRQKEENEEVFRNKVARHKFALRALDRKRRANDLRGSTRIEYLKQLAKEEAALNHKAKSLKKQNPVLFAEVMSEKIRRGLDSKEKKSKAKKRTRPGSNSRQAGDADYHEGVNEGEAVVDQAAAPVLKKRKTNGLVVMTRSQRRAAGMETKTKTEVKTKAANGKPGSTKWPATDQPAVIDLTDMV